MSSSSLLLMSLLFFAYSAASDSSLTRNSTTGVFKGQINSDYYRKVYEFLGIPYGKAPIGDKRFRPAELAPYDENVKQATNLSRPCYQSLDSTFPGFSGTEMWNPKEEMTEDCLTLNIWTPAYARNAPVLVWIFGGGFITGSPSLDIYNGAFLAASTGQVIVAINYRVGPFGFLSLGSSAPPNVGLLDQRLALQWIQSNINNFGGDPNSVTLMGESAGGASVMAHLHAEGSWPLFQRAIVHSGSMAMPWANVRKYKLEEYSRALATALGCSGNNSEMVACMKKQKPEDIVNESANMMLEYLQFIFVPVIDDNDLFFGPKGLQNYRQGITKVAPILLGYNENEGSYWLPIYDPDVFNYKHDGMIDSDTMMRLAQKSFPLLNDEERSELITHYRREEANDRDALSAMVGDYYFTCGVIDLANRLSSNNSRVYVFYFNYRSKWNPWPEWMGAMHGYEMEFVFGLPWRKVYKANSTAKDKIMSYHVIAHWNAFVRDRIAQIDDGTFHLYWPSYQKERPAYVRFAESKVSVEYGTLPHTEACKVFNGFKQGWKKAKNVTRFFRPCCFDV
ncbi:Carboxylesterase [Trichuris suis]|nr:Carboxylesterase [Trichuris suis]